MLGIANWYCGLPVLSSLCSSCASLKNAWLRAAVAASILEYPCYPEEKGVIVSIARALRDIWTRQGGRMLLFTYTGKAKHGGEEQGAAKFGLVGHKIA